MFEFLLMLAMHGLLDFGNAFVATGTFGFSVSLAALKQSLAHSMVHGLVVHGVQRLVILEAD